MASAYFLMLILGVFIAGAQGDEQGVWTGKACAGLGEESDKACAKATKGSKYCVKCQLNPATSKFECYQSPAGTDCSHLALGDRIKAHCDAAGKCVMDPCKPPRRRSLLEDPTCTPCEECKRAGGDEENPDVNPPGDYCVRQECGNCYTCNDNTGTCEYQAGLCNDPSMTGFDGKSFHFNEVGDFMLLEEAGGIKVEATFVGALSTASRANSEKSWTQEVRVQTPNGDRISCGIPTIYTNTSEVAVAVTPADPTQPKVTLSSKDGSVHLAEMSANATVDGFSVTGCHVKTAKLEVIVYQVFGAQQASLFPELEGWAEKYTWLNMNFRLTKPLAHPVTGILGATYKADLEGRDHSLGGLEANLEEDGVGGDEANGKWLAAHGSARALAGASASPLTASVFRRF